MKKTEAYKFSKYFDARNGVIYAPTGQGKSFIVDHLLDQIDSFKLKNIKINLKKKIEDYNFDKNDWDCFHDVIINVTFASGIVNLNQKEMENLFLELPEDIKQEAFKLGMSDTVWRESLWEWYEKNKMNKNSLNL